MKKKRREFGKEFKQEAVALVVDHGYSNEEAGFFHTLKVELVHRERYASRRSATAKIFEYIEVYYNRQRKHSAIGHQIPLLFEQKRP